MRPMLLFLLAFAIISGVLTAQQPPTCGYLVSGQNRTYQLQINCTSADLVFDSNVSNNRLICSAASPTVEQITFGAGSYNNSIVNCTFDGAVVNSLSDAQNNIISPFGNYTLNFTGNASNIALGYYFTFFPKDMNGDLTKEWFAAIAPYELAQANFQVINNQEISMAQVHEVANSINYTLPRFGQYLPTNSTWTSPISFALEAEQISKNGTKSFNPYWFICPDWGYDILSYREFNITHNENYTPFFLKPDFVSDVQLPDSSDIYWNFTVRNYSNATHITAYIFSGYQFEPPGLVENITNFIGSRLSYHEGVKPPGIYQFIGELVSSHNKTYEQANSTSVNYAIGLAFCTQYSSPISYPGRYSMSYPTLSLLNVFTPSNVTCAHAVTVISDNVTIDCRGGIINSTNQTIWVRSAQNVTVENCRLRGNAITADESQVSIINSTLSANNASDAAFRGHGSSISLLGTNVSGYSTYSDMTNSTIRVLAPSNVTATPPASSITTTIAAENATLPPVTSNSQNQTAATQPLSPQARGLAVVLVALAICAMLYALFATRERRQQA